MEVTNNLDAPSGWRSKMKMAEVVDAGIDFRNGLSTGYISINRWQNSKKGNVIHTRAKHVHHLKGNLNSGLNAIRSAGHH